MTEKNFSMNSFHHSIYLDKSVKEVYRYFGQTDGFTKWFIGKAVYTTKNGNQRKTGEFIQAEDEYKIDWLAKDFSTSGKILEAVENSHTKFTFGGLFTVTISVKNDNGRTLFTLKQEYTEGAAHNDFAHINCCVCWGFFVTNLKSVIEFGNDLREIHAQDESLVNR